MNTNILSTPREQSAYPSHARQASADLLLSANPVILNSVEVVNSHFVEVLRSQAMFAKQIDVSPD